MFAAKHLLCPLAGALALRARRQVLGRKVVFVARRSDGLAAEAEDAQRADAVAGAGGGVGGLWIMLTSSALVAWSRERRARRRRLRANTTSIKEFKTLIGLLSVQKRTLKA